MKEYKSNEELINYLLSKGIIVSDKKDRKTAKIADFENNKRY